MSALAPIDHSGPADLFALLARLGIEARTVSHAPLHTVEESIALRGTIPGAHVKNLFLKDKKGRLFLVTAREDAAIDLKRLHEVIGASGRLSFASAERLKAVLGVEPGSVTPLATLNDRANAVSVVLDAGLLASEIINVHPLTNTMTTGLAREGLLAFLRATSHEPLIVDLPAP